MLRLREAEYIEIFGYYLGDGCLTKTRCQSRVYNLRIYNDLKSEHDNARLSTDEGLDARRPGHTRLQLLHRIPSLFTVGWNIGLACYRNMDRAGSMNGCWA